MAERKSVIARLKRVICALTGHRWKIDPSDDRGIGAERNCECGAHWPGTVWPQGSGYQLVAGQCIDSQKLPPRKP